MDELLLPSLGEGIEVGTIVSVLVGVGDEIEKEQSIVEVETDKVTMEVPSPLSGRISEILVKEGDEVAVGQVMFIIKSAEHANDKSENLEKPNQEVESTSQLQGQEAPAEEVSIKEIPQNPAIKRERKEGLRATPKARKLARELGVGIGSVASSQDVIVEEDIKAHINRSGSSHGATNSVTALPSFSKWGSTRTKGMSAVMKATAKNMTQAWREIPHAWLQAEADVTETELQRKELNKLYDLKISLTVFIAKAVAKTLKDFPKFNSSLNYEAQEVIYKDYINIGIAADTEHGLFVPVIKNVDQLSLSQISSSITDLATRAKDKKLKMDELEGGNFTISNLGGFGTTAIFPVILPPQVAILGVASYQGRDGRKYLPLTIGFDHRVIDGADAGRFLQKLTSYLKNPVNILT